MPYTNLTDGKYSIHNKRILNLYQEGLRYSRIAMILKEEFGYEGDGVRKYVTHYIKSVKKGKTVKKSNLKIEHHAKIFIYDIETLPLIAPLWRIWNQNVSHKNLITKEWKMVTWAGKWLFDDKIISAKMKPKEIKAEDDSRVVKLLWEQIDEADIIIAHNGCKFDVRQMNARFLKHGLGLPSPYRVIDTYKAVKKRFDLPSYSLEFVGNFLGLGGKIETGGMQLWMRCLKGEKKAIDEMEAYNIKDITLLEDVYLAIRSYIQPHPNLGLFIEDNVECCPACASKNLKFKGQYATNVNLFNAFTCLDCGAVGRSRKGNLTKKDRSRLMVSVSR